jgi:hypothetical protein
MLVFSIFACQSEQPLETPKSLIMQKTENLFTRIKVRDFSVIWENEFPYLREDSPLEEYLNNDYMKWYTADTLLAVQIDSVSLWEDTAYAHMELEWILADSSLKLDTIRLRWHYSGDEWIKPTISRLHQQLEFEEELRVYWEAVQEMMQEKIEDSEQKSDSN